MVEEVAMLGLREVQQHDCDAFVLACVDVVITVWYQKELAHTLVDAGSVLSMIVTK